MYNGHELAGVHRKQTVYSAVGCLVAESTKEEEKQWQKVRPEISLNPYDGLTTRCKINESTGVELNQDSQGRCRWFSSRKRSRDRSVTNQGRRRHD